MQHSDEEEERTRNGIRPICCGRGANSGRRCQKLISALPVENVRGSAHAMEEDACGRGAAAWAVR